MNFVHWQFLLTVNCKVIQAWRNLKLNRNLKEKMKTLLIITVLKCYLVGI